MSIPLETAVTVTFPASGIASAYLGPDRANVNWKITRLIASSDSTAIPALIVYKNMETPTNRVDSTIDGDAATSETDIDIRSGQKLFCKWTGGTSGKTATLTVYGKLF